MSIGGRQKKRSVRGLDQRNQQLARIHVFRGKFGEQDAAAGGHGLLVNGVEDLLSIAAAGDQFGILEQGQVVGDRRLGQVENVYQIADAHFSFGEQYFQDTLARFIAQRFAEINTVDHCVSLN
jgi:hypothetical protein